MSRNSRRFAGAALFAAWMSIPAVAQAQTVTPERSMMNRFAPELRSQVGEHQQEPASRMGDQSLAARALLGTVDESRFVGPKAVIADAGFPSAEQALTGRRSLAKIRKAS